MKILYVATISNTVNAFLIPHIKKLITKGHRVDVAFNVEQKIDSRIFEMGCKVYEVSFRRNPFSKDNISSYKKIQEIVKYGKYDLVHTHTPVASAITRLACKSMDVKIYYTAHGFHFYTGAPFANWVLYYPVERWLSRYTDTLITINHEDYNRAKKFKKTNAVYAPGVGIDLEKIKSVNIDRGAKREELGIPKESFLMTSVGELNENKNHEVVIRALSQLKTNDIHYVICGIGDLKNKLIELSKYLRIEEQVHFLGFRDDIHEINKASDLFVFLSHREGLPVSLMEAMAAGLPVVASCVRGNIDLIDNQGGFLVSPDDKQGVSKAIHNIYGSTSNEMGVYNQNKIKKYGVNYVLDNMLSIYKGSE